MKEYNFRRQNNNNKLPMFYTKLVLSFILFFIITVICRINTTVREPVKDVLGQSYDFSDIKNKCTIYINKVKDYLSETKDMLVMEE